MADQYTKRVMNAILGLTPTYTLYPVIGTGVLAGTTVTSGAAAWGSNATLIAAAAIASEYWLCGFDLDTAGAAQPYLVDIQIAGTTSVTSFRVDLTAITVNLSRIPAATFPIYIPAGSALTSRASGTAAKALNVSTLVATGF